MAAASAGREKLNWKRLVANGLCLITGLSQLYALSFGNVPEMSRRVSFWTFMMVALFLLNPSDRKRYGTLAVVWDGLCILGALSSGLQIFFGWERIALAAGAVEPRDVLFATVAILVTLEATRRTVGWILVCIPAILIVYALFGSGLPGLLAHRGYSFERVVTSMYKTTEGLFGIPTSTAATYVIVFVVFGAFLDRFGAGKAFVDLAYRLTRRTRGGPAKAAVVSSALLGTISGSSTGNVVTTGTFTIPLMVRVGYPPAFAGAVEAAASCGGMIMPPVMGAAAFLMAEMTGIPYRTIALAAALPAVLYFASILITVDLRALKSRIGEMGADESVGKGFDWRNWYVFLPLVQLIFLMTRGVSAPNAAIDSILGVMAVALVFGRAGIKGVIQGAVEAVVTGVRRAVPIAAACASAGLIVGVIGFTGLGAKLTDAILILSGERLLLTLMLTAVISLILSTGLPTTAVYVIVSVLLAPALIRMGVPMLAAHLFIFYFGMLSSLTPPVALGAYAAAGIAGSDPTATAFAGFRLALAGFIIPFAFVVSPALLTMGTLAQIGLAALTGLIGVALLAVAVEGFLLSAASPVERVSLLVAAVLLVVYTGAEALTGAALGALAIALHIIRHRRYGPHRQSAARV